MRNINALCTSAKRYVVAPARLAQRYARGSTPLERSRLCAAFDTAPRRMALRWINAAAACSHAGAVNWLCSNANAGDPLAMNALGKLFRAGAGLPKSDAAARQWFERAARVGYVPAMLNLASDLWDGVGTQPDRVTACAWVLAALRFAAHGSDRVDVVASLRRFWPELDEAERGSARRMARHIASLARRGDDKPAFALAAAAQ